MSRCIASPTTAPETVSVPQPSASPHQLPVPEIVEPLVASVRLTEFPGIASSLDQLPATIAGSRVPEQAATAAPSNNTDITSRIQPPPCSEDTHSIFNDYHRIAI